MSASTANIEDQKLRMDIPDLGLSRAVVNVIGDVGRNRGFLIFPSAVGCEGFRTTIDGTGYIPFGTTSFGTEVLGLTFQDVAAEHLDRLPDQRERHRVAVRVDGDLSDAGSRCRLSASRSRRVNSPRSRSRSVDSSAIRCGGDFRSAVVTPPLCDNSKNCTSQKIDTRPGTR